MAAPVAIAPPAVVPPTATVDIARPLAVASLPPQLSSLATGTQIAATVAGSDASGRTLLRTDAGQITAARKLDIQRGTLLTLEVRDVGGQSILTIRTITPPPGADGTRSVHNESQPQPHSGTGTPTLGSAGLPLPTSPVSSPALIDGLALLRSWPALAAALQTLVAADPAFARALARRRLPTVDGDLALAAARFAAVLTAHKGLGAMLGRDALDLLRRARADLGRLEDDMDRLADIGTPPGPEDWRTIPIPIVAPHGLGQMRLLVRGGDGAPGPSRFVVDLLLARLGPVQLDGLVAADRFDLTVRSILRLPDAIVADIQRLFDGTRAALHQQGSIHFAMETAFPVSPEAVLGARGHGTWEA